MIMLLAQKSSVDEQIKELVVYPTFYDSGLMNILLVVFKAASLFTTNSMIH